MRATSRRGERQPQGSAAAPRGVGKAIRGHRRGRGRTSRRSGRLPRIPPAAASASSRVAAAAAVEDSVVASEEEDSGSSKSRRPPRRLQPSAPRPTWKGPAPSAQTSTSRRTSRRSGRRLPEGRRASESSEGAMSRGSSSRHPRDCSTSAEARPRSAVRRKGRG